MWKWPRTNLHQLFQCHGWYPPAGCDDKRVWTPFALGYNIPWKFSDKNMTIAKAHVGGWKKTPDKVERNLEPKPNKEDMNKKDASHSGVMFFFTFDCSKLYFDTCWYCLDRKIPCREHQRMLNKEEWQAAINIAKKEGQYCVPVFFMHYMYITTISTFKWVKGTYDSTQSIVYAPPGNFDGPGQKCWFLMVKKLWDIYS